MVRVGALALRASFLRAEAETLHQAGNYAAAIARLLRSPRHAPAIMSRCCCARSPAHDHPVSVCLSSFCAACWSHSRSNCPGVDLQLGAVRHAGVRQALCGTSRTRWMMWAWGRRAVLEPSALRCCKCALTCRHCEA